MNAPEQAGEPWVQLTSLYRVVEVGAVDPPFTPHDKWGPVALIVQDHQGSVAAAVSPQADDLRVLLKNRLHLKTFPPRSVRDFLVQLYRHNVATTVHVEGEAAPGVDVTAALRALQARYAALGCPEWKLCDFERPPVAPPDADHIEL